MIRVNVRLHWPWWGKTYIIACCAFAVLTGCTPNHDKIARFVAKRIKYTFIDDAKKPR